MHTLALQRFTGAPNDSRSSGREILGGIQQLFFTSKGCNDSASVNKHPLPCRLLVEDVNVVLARIP